MSLRSKLISQQHLRRGVTRSQKVLEQVSRVVPATKSVKLGSGRQWSIRSATIECMPESIGPWLVAPALLAHERDQLNDRGSIRRLANVNPQRARLAGEAK